METMAHEWNHDVTITNTTDDTAVLGLAGPRSRDILSKLTDTDLSHKQFPFLHAKEINVAGVDLRAIRISYTGILSVINMTFCIKITVFDLITAPALITAP